MIKRYQLTRFIVFVKVSIMKKSLLALCLCSTLSAPVFAADHISISGSTSVTEVMDVLAEIYQKENPNVEIDVNGIGSSAGIKAAASGVTDLGMASRDLTPSEKELGLVEHVIAKDGIAVVVNPTNAVTSLTTDQIKNLFDGSVENWQQVGGSDNNVVVASRESGSGTRGAFEELMHLTKKINNFNVSTITRHGLIASGNGIEKTTVANNQQAIGFISLGSVDSSVKTVDVNGAKATVQNVINGSYPISRPFIVLNQAKKLSQPAQQFVNWMESKEAQTIISKRGYISTLKTNA